MNSIYKRVWIDQTPGKFKSICAVNISDNIRSQFPIFVDLPRFTMELIAFSIFMYYRKFTTESKAKEWIHHQIFVLSLISWQISYLINLMHVVAFHYFLVEEMYDSIKSNIDWIAQKHTKTKVGCHFRWTIRKIKIHMNIIR